MALVLKLVLCMLCCRSVRSLILLLWLIVVLFLRARSTRSLATAILLAIAAITWEYHGTSHVTSVTLPPPSTLTYYLTRVVLLVGVLVVCVAIVFRVWVRKAIGKKKTGETMRVHVYVHVHVHVHVCACCYVQSMIC